MEWKYKSVNIENVELPSFLDGNVEFENGILVFEVLDMEYDLQDNELFVSGEEILLNTKCKPKNKEVRDLFNKLNKTDLKDSAFFKEFKKYLKNVQSYIEGSITEMIFNMIEESKTGDRTNDLIQAVKDLLMDAELKKTYNGYVLPLANNVCRPVNETEIIEFIEDVTGIRGISSDTVERALKYFNREAKPEFNCIVTANGYYDFNNGEFYTESTEPIVINKFSPYNYRPELIGTAPPEKLHNFLNETFSNDINKIYAFLEITGYLIDDGNAHQKLPLYLGKGRNGKGVCLELQGNLLNNNISHVDIFSVDFNSKYSAPLIKSNLNVINEVKNTRNIAEVKDYTGGGGLMLSNIYKASKKYRDIELPKSVLATNNFKGVNEDDLDYAMKRRLNLFIEFENIVPDEKQNPKLVEELIAEPEAMDWLLTNSIHEYQKIKDKGVRGKFRAQHNEYFTNKMLQKYIDPVAYTIEENFIYDFEKWSEYEKNSYEKRDELISQNDIIDVLNKENISFTLGKKKKNILYAVCRAFGLDLGRNGYDDFIDGVLDYFKIGSSKTESKTVLVGLLRRPDINDLPRNADLFPIPTLKERIDLTKC